MAGVEYVHATAKLPPDFHDEIRAKAKSENPSVANMAHIIRVLLAAYLDGRVPGIRILEAQVMAKAPPPPTMPVVLTQPPIGTELIGVMKELTPLLTMGEEALKKLDPLERSLICVMLCEAFRAGRESQP